MFVWSAPTFEDRMKQLKEGAGICNFKALKYETRTPDEQKRIEDLVMEKMGVWKYSPAQMKPQVHPDLYDKIITRWDLTTQTVKDIFEQQLRQLVPSLSNNEVKEALSDHGDRMILKLNTCFILMNNSESIIRQATDVWKDFYHLRQPSAEAVEIKDDDSSDDEQDTQGVLHALADAEEEDKQEEDKDEDTVRIAAEVIASLPHTPPVTVTSVESASTSEIATSTATSVIQSPLSSSQL